jgi:tripartite-type tricarboxylate transporter receptor subunit TctC
VLSAAPFLLAAMLIPGAAHAEYPEKPIKILVSILPGGTPDVLARAIGEQLAPMLGQPIIVDNRLGANGNIALETMAKSPADGYTLLMAQDSLIVTNPHLYPKMSVNTLKDIVPVAMVASTGGLLLVVPPSLPVKSLQELIEYSKTANPPLAYASAGNGSMHHLAMETLKLRTGMNLLHVPYKGGGPAMTATISGEVSASISSAVTTGPQVRAGKLRALAVTGNKRLAGFPDLPTITETYSGVEVSSWFGVFAPAGTPEPVLAKLRSGIVRVLEMPDVQKRLLGVGEFVSFSAPHDEFVNRIRNDHEKFGKLVKQIGVKLD